MNKLQYIFKRILDIRLSMGIRLPSIDMNFRMSASNSRLVSLQLLYDTFYIALAPTFVNQFQLQFMKA